MFCEECNMLIHDGEVDKDEVVSSNLTRPTSTLI